MLLRAYRLTDKVGIIALKLLLFVTDTLLEGIGVVVGIVWIVLRAILRLIGWIIRPLLLLLRALVLAIFSASRGTARRGTMARQATRERAAMGTAVSEDPLKVQNRLLSGLTVVLLAAMVGVILWATGPARSGATSPAAAPVAFDPALFASAAPTLSGASVPTAAPTETAIPSILGVRGAVAYTVRENGQSDIWAVAIGGRDPIRLTNDPADDRDPAFSPDGRQLAYASRRDGNWELYLYDLVTGATRRLTTDIGFQANPSWSSDAQWIAYENYQGAALDIYVLRLDGSQAPIRLPSNSDSADYSPAWSPDGRRIAFVSLRDGNQDLYVFSLDDQSVINVTRTPERDEDHPSWSPDGRFLAYSALDEGREKVFVIPVDDPDAGATVIALGRTPVWSPDGSSILAPVDSIDGAQLIVTPFTGGVTNAAILPAPSGVTSPTWTSASLPSALVAGGGLPSTRTEALFTEAVEVRAGDPPYRLNAISGVRVENAVLSDRVNDSFNALRAGVNEAVGVDFLGSLDDAFWRIDRPPQAGAERRNWLMTGRAFAIPRNAIVGFPPPLEVVREDVGVDTQWRLYVRVAESAQAGGLGEPLRRLPWDFAARTAGDVEAYDQGGRRKATVPTGYYIDLTQMAADYGWQRMPAGSDWRANSNTINYWLFYKPDDLTWLEAMREIYTQDQLGGFAPTAAPAGGAAPTRPAPTLEIQPSAAPATSAPAADFDPLALPDLP